MTRWKGCLWKENNQSNIFMSCNHHQSTSHQSSLASVLSTLGKKIMSYHVMWIWTVYDSCHFLQHESFYYFIRIPHRSILSNRKSVTNAFPCLQWSREERGNGIHRKDFFGILNEGHRETFTLNSCNTHVSWQDMSWQSINGYVNEIPEETVG